MFAGDFLLFACFAYGFAFGIQYKAIPWLLSVAGEPAAGPGLPERWLRGLGACAYCSGFWGGVAWLAEPWLPRLVVLGIAAAGLCFALDRWTE